MPSRSSDFVGLLRKTVADLEVQLLQAKAALAAAERVAAENPVAPDDAIISQSLEKRRKIRWTKEVRAVLKDLPDGRIDIDGMCQLLAERGVPVESERARSNVQTALARQVGKRFGQNRILERTEPGVYRLKTEYQVDTRAPEPEQNNVRREEIRRKTRAFMPKNEGMTSSDEEDTPF